ncbi:MAG: tetratricopeptide repeat protein [Candidatus Aminicenantes bacterium]|nr:tetratricopeptide repeat protein [Candidatus Aminicenantes bacterium]NIM83248.1 tetratricopeptide repeat protein [Candidatus Aminicenantes bacterium]NIN22619.1 tetratricopeptide repeat protein [Candidatus Aminicenantes bacterium]NIN46378.1 tetratricopeptide repeat protein [Candidatus Aminicenantes bacterium]NIN89228.1 tetratricopeptide repeat protein [Candidatus Aminicenantes bacterium]
MKKQIFISHSSKDDEFVKALGKSLEIQGFDTWIDSRELVGGDQLEPEIKKAIEKARAFIVVISLNTINSPWVLKEIKYALEIKKKKKRKKDYPVIPLMLEGIEPTALNLYFDKEPVGIKVQIGAGGIAEAMPQILAALGERKPDDIQPMLRPEPEPLEELVLELTDPCIVEKDGKRRAQAEARLIYFPGEKGKREVESKERFLFTAPLGAIESEELSWYLERYYTWPVGVFKQRAENVEKQLPEWGKALYDAVLNDESVRNVLSAWYGAKGKTGRRFTVFVDSRLVKGTEEEKQAEANEAATLLLSLPWELLHDEDGYLFMGAKPVQVRRRLPNTHSLEGTVSEPPIRILLVSPRPEDDKAGYIDHRVSALPLVTALESLGDLAELTVLSPPTFKAFEKELNRAQEKGTPYHVVHFDGHGVFRKDLGLGGLCFEDTKDHKKLEKRRSFIVDADELAKVIRHHRIPLFFLEACQTAKAEEDPTTSVAAALLDVGVASVVAMSHSVLVETARRFVQGFYTELVVGARVGKAMLEGQRELKSDSFRLKIFGAGRLDLQDWFVPVLFQEKEDLQLLTRVPTRDIVAIDRKKQERRFGKLPPVPEHHFIGRSRELLKLERLLAQKSYAVLCGQGGEGKTTLAAELARWLIRTGRFFRAVFVCMEDIYDVRTVVDRMGQQLVPNYSVAEYPDAELMNKALQPIERQLRNERTLVILDNMESILPLNKSFCGGSTRGAVFLKSAPLSLNTVRFEPEALKTFFDLCKKLQSIGDTCLLFTSREKLPEPFAVEFQRVILSRLDKKDAVELVHQAMTVKGLTPREDDRGGTQPEVEALVEAVNCHARSLVLLAPYISEFGVRHTTENLGRLMAELHKQYPDERERSLFASVELSLGRLSPGIREKIRPLGVFQGGGHIVVIQEVLGLKEEERDLLARELVQTGLGELMAYGFLRFHPALCPYLRQEMDEAELVESTARWAQSMKQLSDYLYKEFFKDAQLALNLTTLELPNLVQLLEHVRAQEEPEETIDLAAAIEQLIAQLGRPHLLAQVTAIREEEAKKLGDENWSHIKYLSEDSKIDRLLEKGNLSQALENAQILLKKCITAGEHAYSGADYDIALAYLSLGRVLKKRGAAEAALSPIDEALHRFQHLADRGDDDAARTASTSLGEKGECLLYLGRLDEAASTYEESIKIFEKLENKRQVAVAKFWLGSVRLEQGRYLDAIEAYEKARKTFDDLGEPKTVGQAWHQTGIVYEKAGRFEAAEQAYRQSLAIFVQQNDPASEASSLVQLGNLYHKMGRFEDTVIFYRQAVDKSVEIGDKAKEGHRRNNLAATLIKLKRFDEARQEIKRAIECKKPYGHASEPWKTYGILYDLEQAEGNKEAAERARGEAIRLYLAYRRDGGENHSGGGRLCYDFLQAIQENKTEEMAAILTELSNHPEIDQSLIPLIPKLQAILAGSRDKELAADPELAYTDAAEILFLLEKIK